MSFGSVWLVEDDRSTPLPAPWGPLTSHRAAESWTWRRLNRERLIVEDSMDGIVDGSLSMNVSADTRWSGSLSWSGRVEDMPEWRDILVQPVHSVRLSDGSTVEWDMGVYICATPKLTYDDAGWVDAQVDLFDRTLRLRRAKLTRAEGVTKGTPVVAAVRHRINLSGSGFLTHAIEDSDAVLPSTLVWEAGTSWLTVINGLLSAIGYESLHADPQGILRAGPYVEPGDRPIVWSFEAGQTAMHQREVDWERDDFDTPNRVTVISRGDGELEGMTAMANLSLVVPGHPWSEFVTGSYVDRIEDGVDATDMAALEAYARRLLLAGISRASSVTVRHAPLPIGPHSRCTTDVVGSGTVQTMSIPCTPGEDWTTTLREVLT